MTGGTVLECLYFNSNERTTRQVLQDCRKTLVITPAPQGCMFRCLGTVGITIYGDARTPTLSRQAYLRKLCPLFRSIVFCTCIALVMGKIDCPLSPSDIFPLN